MKYEARLKMRNEKNQESDILSKILHQSNSL